MLLKPALADRPKPPRFPAAEFGDERIRMFRPSFLGLIYLIVGVAVAASYDYFERLNTIRRILSAVLAVLLWPLLLLGIDLHIRK
jgi:membrane associated rhomboid family serine protease